MPLLALFLITILAVWACALLRMLRQGAFQEIAGKCKRLNPIPLLALATVISGSVLGNEFLSIPAGPIPITIDRLLFGGVVALSAWFFLTNREDLRRLNGLDLAMILLIGVLTMSMAMHDFKFEDNMPLSRLLFFNLIPFGIYVVGRTVRMSELDLKVITITFGAFSVYLALTAIAETRGFHSLVFPRFIVSSETTEFLGRGRGPFLNPVSNGMFLLCGLSCIWFWWPKFANSFRKRAFLVALSLIVVAGVYSTLTRSVWMSLVLVAGMMIWLPSPRQQKGLMMVAGFLVVLLATPFLGDKLFKFKRDKEVSVADMSKSAQLRPLFAIVAWRMFQERPMLGCGFGQYPREKFPYLQDAYSGQPLAMTKDYTQHNVFLAYLTETGLIGLLSLLLALAVMAHLAWRLYQKKQRTLLQRQFGMLLGSVLIVYCVNGMFHDTSIVPLGNLLLFYAAALANNVLTAIPEQSAVRSKSGCRKTTLKLPATRAPNALSGRRKSPATNS